MIAFAGGDNLSSGLALLKGVRLALGSGYTSSTGFAPIDVLASRGGMASMLNTVWLVITALAFGGVVEKAGVLDQNITPIINAAKSAGALATSLVAAVVTTNIVTADQYERCPAGPYVQKRICKTWICACRLVPRSWPIRNANLSLDSFLE